MILVDTSVWVDHFRSGVPNLAASLEAARVAGHPFIIGELALGNFRQRDLILALLQALPSAVAAHDGEILAFIERRRLWGRGIGLVDAHLLSACHLSPGMQLWTRDKRLRSLAQEQGVAAALD